MDKELSDIIYGKNHRTNIVNISYKDGGLDIYYDNDGVITKQTEFYTPYVLTTQAYPSSVRLKGFQAYKYKSPVVNSNYDELWARGIYKPRTIEEGYMAWTGTSLFKGLRPEDVSILGCDIETTTIDPNKPNAKVLLISNTLRRRGDYTRKMFDLREYGGNERAMIDDWCDWVRSVDPTIITGHNIISFDMYYLHNRALNNDTSLRLGRDGSSITMKNRVSKYRKDGSQQYEFYNILIHGRDIVDTFFLSMKYDQASRNFVSYGLKNLEKQLDLVDGDRIEWNFEENPPSEVYENGAPELWEQFKDYCRMDSDSPIKLFDLMIPPYFYLNRSIPKTLQQMVNEASGSYIDSFLVRSYLQHGYSQPLTSQKVEFEGAVSMGVPGMYENVCKVDVAAMYPSIMMQYDIYDKKKDPKRHMLKALDFFRTQRLVHKKLAEEGSKHDADMDASIKVYINSNYGALGANYLLYNYPRGASEITRRGRDILLQGVEWATGHTLSRVVKKIKNKDKPTEEIQYHWVVGDKVETGRYNFTLANVDTDSFAICNPNGPEPTKEWFDRLIKELNSIYPEYIKWADDGVYSKFMVVGAKNYIMQKHPLWCKPKDLDKNGNPKVKYKGSSIVDPKKERALSDMIKSMIDIIFNGRPNSELVEIYQDYVKQAYRLKDIDRWSTKKTVTAAVLEGSTSASVKALEACKEAVERGVIKNFQEGDKFWVYQAMDGETQKIVKGQPQFYKKTGLPMMVPKTALRFPKLWNGIDHDRMHYVNRVYDTALILDKVVDKDLFIDYNIKRNAKKFKELVGE